jgi:hypothetical protein
MRSLSLSAIASVCGLLLLGACAPAGPGTAAGGFADYRSAPAGHQAQSPLFPPRQVVSLPTQPHSGAVPTTGAPASEAASLASAALASVRPGAAAPGTAAGGVGDPLPLPDGLTAGTAPAGGGAITRDDVLDMETARATREAEQAAFERRRAEFQSVAPTALPDRPADVPNITAFAVNTSHGVGTQRYARSRLTLQNTARNCAEFASADLAQEEFLRRGGPQSDPLNIDPDGDGFACGWSPEPFRAAARAAR